MTNLGDGDCLLYNFAGSLNVGFGVTYGLSGTVSASSITQISKLFTGNQFFSVTAPTLSYGVNAGASAQFNWSRTSFRIPVAPPAVGGFGLTS